MVNPIPESVKNLWENWNIRGVILFSLFLQTLLMLFASRRKGTDSKLTMVVIWSAYLLADWVANLGAGLIADRARDRPTDSKQQQQFVQNNELLALWAPFMLLHLGGPDTITAFSLEDNELWLRHLFGFTFQVVAAVYIFVLSLPGNHLFFPTALVFVAGIIKYSERIRALYLASAEKFQDSSINEFRCNRREVKINQDRDCLVVGCEFFKFFKVILAGFKTSFDPFFLNEAPSFGEFSPEDALGIIEVELNLVYEVFYTKILVTHTVLGIILRFISFGSVAAALSIFHFQVQKHDRFFHDGKFDVGITYTLFLGAMVLDTISFSMLVSSDWTFAALMNENEDKSSLGKIIKSRMAAAVRRFIILKRPRWRSHRNGRYEVLATPFAFRRWSGSVPGLSWIRYWLNINPYSRSTIQKITHYLSITVNGFIHSLRIHKICHFLHIHLIIALLRSFVRVLVALFGLRDIVFRIKIIASLSREPLTKELWMFIFGEMKRKAEKLNDSEAADKNRIFSVTGECTLMEADGEGELIKFARHKFGGLAKVKSRDHYIHGSFTTWHFATDLLYYYTAEAVVSDEKTYNAREFSKILSDYMMYLLHFKATMLNSSATYSRLSLEESSDAATKYFTERKGLEKPSYANFACENIMHGETDYLNGGWSSVREARELSDELQKLEESRKWETVSKVWVELLSYAAINCLPATHAQQVTNGGELITFVWLMMLHFRLVEETA